MRKENHSTSTCIITRGTLLENTIKKVSLGITKNKLQIMQTAIK